MKSLVRLGVGWLVALLMSISIVPMAHAQDTQNPHTAIGTLTELPDPGSLELNVLDTFSFDELQPLNAAATDQPLGSDAILGASFESLDHSSIDELYLNGLTDNVELSTTLLLLSEYEVRLLCRK